MKMNIQGLEHNKFKESKIIFHTCVFVLSLRFLSLDYSFSFIIKLFKYFCFLEKLVKVIFEGEMISCITELMNENKFMKRYSRDVKIYKMEMATYLM